MSAAISARRASRWGAGSDAALVEHGVEAGEGVTFRPSGQLVGRDVVGAGRLLVPPHPVRLELEQRGAVAPPSPLGRLAHGGDDGEDVVAVHHRPGHPVAGGPVGEVARRRTAPGSGSTGPSRCSRSRRPPAAATRRPGSWPRGSRLRWSRRRRRTTAATRRSLRSSEARASPQATGSMAPRWLIIPTTWCSGAPKWNVRSRPSVNPSALANSWRSRRSRSKPRAVNTPDVAVQGQDPVVGPQGGGHADGDGLLADPGEPFRQAALADEPQHLLLDQPGQEQRRGQVATVRRR